MVSLSPCFSSVAATPTLKQLNPQFRKYPPPTSFSIDKDRSISLHTRRFLSFQEALSFAKEGTEEVLSSFCIPLLQQCLDNSSFSGTQMVHTHIIKTGSHKDYFLMTSLVEIYAKCGKMEEARKIFDQMPKRDFVHWTILIMGYLRNSQPKHVIHVFEEMLHSGISPSIYTLGIALNACTSLHSLKLGEQLHAYIIKYCVEFDTTIGTILSSLYYKCGELEHGLKAFRRIDEKDVISWTTAITACGDNGNVMRGLRVFVEMLSEDVHPDEYTLTRVLSQCCEVASLEIGTQVHSLYTKLGYDTNLRVRIYLLYLYLKCGCISEAQMLFNGIDGDLNLMTWNAMIAGHGQMMEKANDNLAAYQSGSKALKLFSNLNRSALKPDPFTFSSVLSVCSRMMALEPAEQVHAQIIKTGILSDVVVGSSLINMYNKCGSIERASKAFLEMSIRTVISWTSMITGFAQHGWSQQALNLFEDMKLVGVRPNRITFLAVLSACGSAGMVNEAFNYFEIMQKEYEIKPGKDHYVYLVDMLVRCGQLEEAFNIIKNMDCDDNEVIWSNLIAGCLSQGNLDLGCSAAELLLSFKPKDAETYVLLSNMYRAAGRIEDVSRVKSVMKKEKVVKSKDWSWISIKDKVYSFETIEKAESNNSVLCKSLEDLVVKAKDLGYGMFESIEISDEEEDLTPSSAIYHSEMLAITFGLENLPKSSPIRVIKNTLMSRDCHNFIRYVSTLTNREIIVKDSKRGHKFVNGQCSCGNFDSFI